jgi:prepilin-type N-terminal cleavage/methylation domain-containing protein
MKQKLLLPALTSHLNNARFFTNAMNKLIKMYNHKYKLLATKNNKGFSLIELIVTMAISSMVIALVSQLLLQTQNSFSKDQKRVSTNQKMSSVLEIIGREIRQAGELITDPDFPTIKVTPLSTGSNPPVSLIVYRAISNPISMCTAHANNTTVNRLFFAIDTVTNPTCRVLPASVAAGDTFPTEQQDGWISQRTAAGGRIFGMVANNPLPVGSPRVFRPFLYDNELSAPGANSLNLSIGISPIVTTGTINIADSAYLVVKKEYLICESDLVVRINSSVESTLNNPACADPNPTSDPTGRKVTVATNITNMNINMITRLRPTPNTPDPVSDDLNGITDGPGNGNNLEFPMTNPIRNWQSIQGVVVNIISADPGVVNNPSDRFSSQGTFYPRNALSTR